MGKNLELNLVSASFERDPEDPKFERMVDNEGKEVFNGHKGFPQPLRYKDWTFGVLFLFHLALVIFQSIILKGLIDYSIYQESMSMHLVQIKVFQL